MVPQPALVDVSIQHFGRDKMPYVPVPRELQDTASTAHYIFHIIAN